MSFPSDLRYTRSHEWARIEGDTVTVGISWFAQDSMGDVVHIESPAVGETVQKGEAAGEIESVKAVSDLYSPVTGEVIAVNEGLEENPEAVNDDPYGAGWLFQVRTGDAVDESELLSALDYEAHCTG